MSFTVLPARSVRQCRVCRDCIGPCRPGTPRMIGHGSAASGRSRRENRRPTRQPSKPAPQK
jgi:hypothetical protein